MELTQDSLEQAILKLSTMTDDRGILMHPRKLCVSSSMLENAKAIAETIILPNHEIEVDFK